MAVKQLPKISDLPEPPDRLVGDQERFDVLTFNSLKAQKKMINEDLNKTLIPALNQFAVDVNASVDAAKASETLALASKNAAASSAATATTKAGEAAASATAAKASETSALASKNAAGISAATASNAQKAAEAARDEAQELANVGYASESRAGLAKVDGKTTQAAADGAITVKDVAIGGDLGDLASARSLTAKFIKGLGSVDFNTIAENMIASVYQTGTTNGPGFSSVLLSFFSSAVMGVQAAFISNSSTIVRASLRSKSTNGYSPWSDFLMSGRVGDGIEVNNGIPSVPEMQGATASAAGTSGLVPPAAAGQHESFLTGGGEYKPALTKISDSVNLADSKTAASATAVKAAYDRGTEALTVAEAALPKTGGDITGQLKINSDYVALAGSDTKFNRTGYPSSPPLVWGGTHDDLVNYNLFYTDQLRVYGANRAGRLCHGGDFDSAITTTTFFWDASIETSFIAAFSSDGSALHPTTADSLTVYKSAALSGCVARVNGQAIGLAGTWLVIFVGNDFNIKTAVIDGGAIPATENKNYVAIRIQ